MYVFSLQISIAWHFFYNTLLIFYYHTKNSELNIISTPGFLSLRSEKEMFLGPKPASPRPSQDWLIFRLLPFRQLKRFTTSVKHQQKMSLKHLRMWWSLTSVTNDSCTQTEPSDCLNEHFISSESPSQSTKLAVHKALQQLDSIDPVGPDWNYIHTCIYP